VVGITLGVAVAVAIDLANASASRAFDLSTESIAGRATHFIAAGPGGVDESLYAELLWMGLPYPLAPVIAEYVTSPQLGGGLIQLLGVDPFAESPFRNYISAQPGSSTNVLGDLTGFLTQPGAILLSTSTADRYGMAIGDVLELELGGKMIETRIVGLIQPSDNLSRKALESLILVDIATAQELTGKLGKIDRIDLIIPDEDENEGSAAEAIIQLLPQGTRLFPIDARTGTVKQMTDAFRVNLSALSLMALVVGVFLIYNTITFSVVQRRPLFGTLRCLGVTRVEVFYLVVIEAFLVGAAGAVLGVLAGVTMGQGAVHLVTRTINDLFFVVNVQGVQIPAGSLLKGSLLGIWATVLAAIPPAWEAASVPPRAALSRSGLERKAHRAVYLAAVGGILIVVVGIFFLFLSETSLWLSFVGTLCVIIGFALLAPFCTVLITRFASPLAGLAWRVMGRMALRNVINSLSRTSVAVAALMVAVAVTIGVSLMIGSFRHTVQIWLDQVLQGDIYLSAPSLIATQSSAPLDPRVVSFLEGWPGIEQIFTLRAVTVDSPYGPVHINASSNPHVGEDRLYLELRIPMEQVEASMFNGAVIVSEPFANRLRAAIEDGSIELYTDKGLINFPIIGIFYDYTSTLGTVLMAQTVYRQFWEDQQLTAISLMLKPGVDPDQTSIDLRDAIAPLQRLVVRPNLILRNEVFEVFERTFAITQALQLLATVVAFIGVFSALLSLELERQRELGILRAVGITTRQLWGLVMLETSMLGSTAGLLAMPTGYTLALILVYIINRRSFGWTLQMQVPPDPFILAFIIAVLAALLAGIYPAWRMSRMAAVEAIRFE
jgi:putative ABC transport system permease protein